MKNCIKCGAELNDDAKFCKMCGEKQPEVTKAFEEVKEEAVTEVKEETEEKPIEVEAEAEPKEKPLEVEAEASSLDDEKKIVKSITIGKPWSYIICAGIVIIVLLTLFGGKGPKNALKSYMKAFEKGNASTMVNLSLPKEGLSDYYDDRFDVSPKEYVEAFQPVYDALWDSLRDEGKVKFEYEIKALEDFNKLDELKKTAKSFGVKDLDDFLEQLDGEYGDYFEAEDVSKGFVGEVKWTITVDGKKAAKGTSYPAVFKYKGKYYVLEGLNVYQVINSLSYDKYEDVIDEVTEALEDFRRELR